MLKHEYLCFLQQLKSFFTAVREEVRRSPRPSYYGNVDYICDQIHSSNVVF